MRLSLVKHVFVAVNTCQRVVNVCFYATKSGKRMFLCD